MAPVHLKAKALKELGISSAHSLMFLTKQEAVTLNIINMNLVLYKC